MIEVVLAVVLVAFIYSSSLRARELEGRVKLLENPPDDTFHVKPRA